MKAASSAGEAIAGDPDARFATYSGDDALLRIEQVGSDFPSPSMCQPLSVAPTRPARARASSSMSRVCSTGKRCAGQAPALFAL